MSDAPERIWASVVDNQQLKQSGVFVAVGPKHPSKPNPDAMQYIRADIHREELEAVREACVAACQQAANTMGVDPFPHSKRLAMIHQRLYQGWDKGCEKAETLIRALDLDEILKEDAGHALHKTGSCSLCRGKP